MRKAASDTPKNFRIATPLKKNRFRNTNENSAM